MQDRADSDDLDVPYEGFRCPAGCATRVPRTLPEVNVVLQGVLERHAGGATAALALAPPDAPERQLAAATLRTKLRDEVEARGGLGRLDLAGSMRFGQHEQRWMTLVEMQQGMIGVPAPLGDVSRETLRRQPMLSLLTIGCVLWTLPMIFLTGFVHVFSKRVWWRTPAGLPLWHAPILVVVRRVVLLLVLFWIASFVVSHCRAFCAVLSLSGIGLMQSSDMYLFASLPMAGAVGKVKILTLACSFGAILPYLLGSGGGGGGGGGNDQFGLDPLTPGEPNATKSWALFGRALFDQRYFAKTDRWAASFDLLGVLWLGSGNLTGAELAFFAARNATAPADAPWHRALALPPCALAAALELTPDVDQVLMAAAVTLLLPFLLTLPVQHHRQVNRAVPWNDADADDNVAQVPHHMLNLPLVPAVHDAQLTHTIRYGAPPVVFFDVETVHGGAEWGWECCMCLHENPFDFGEGGIATARYTMPHLHCAQCQSFAFNSQQEMLWWCRDCKCLNSIDVQVDGADCSCLYCGIERPAPIVRALREYLNEVERAELGIDI